jgi:hypothetical protein
MIIHIFNNQKKFSKGYFQFLHDNGFNLSDMKLVHYGKKDDFFSTEVKIDNYFIRNYISVIGNARLLKDLLSADKVIVHSLASPALLLFLTLFPVLQKKVVWIIWGKDLHFYRLINRKRFYHRIYEWFRIKSIRNIGTIVTSIREDYDILKEIYQVSGNFIECNALYFYSFSNSLGEVSDSSELKTILLGNSGSESNKHKEAIQILSTKKENISIVYCPLSYGGSKKYREEIIEFGNRLFGDKFVPLVDFIPLEQYKQILAEVDIGIFNHDRQEGLANVWTLIFLGKTIYLKNDVSSALYFRRVGIKINSVEDICKIGLISQECEILKENQQVLLQIMSAENSVESWKKIFAA